MSSLLGIIILAVLVSAFGALLVWVSGAFGPKVEKSAAKMMPYECGLPGQEVRDTKISVKFYLTAMLFILFDIEVIFMYPWAVTLDQIGWAGFSAMMSFMTVLVVGLVYVWRRGVLDWA